MIFNFCSSTQFQTRLTVNDEPIEQVSECRLLGVNLDEKLKWHQNTANLVKRAYQRMTILRNLSNFNVPEQDLIHIYNLYIRSIVEQSSVVWGSSITEGEAAALERTQKAALRSINTGRFMQEVKCNIQVDLYDLHRSEEQEGHLHR